MTISLTQEEFYQRLLERRKLLIIAINEDVKNIFPLRYKTGRNKSEINIDITEPIGELLLKEITRVVDLVYREGLD